eukprot:555312_1
MSGHEDQDDEKHGSIFTISQDSNYIQPKTPLRANNEVEMHQKHYTITVNDENQPNAGEEEIPTGSSNKNQYAKDISIITDGYKEDENSDEHLSEEKQLSTFNNEVSPLYYALNKQTNNKDITQHKTKIIQYFEKENIATKLNQIPAEQFSNDVVNYCDNNKKLKKPLLELYELIQFKQIKSNLPIESPNKDSSKISCCSCRCCYSEFTLQEIEVINREEIENKLVLQWRHTNNNQSLNPNQPEMESKMLEIIKHGKQVQEHEALNVPLQSKKQIEISSDTYNIQCVDSYPYFLKGDILCKMGEYDLTRINPSDVYQIIKHEELPFKLTFKSKQCSCINYTRKQCNHCMNCTKSSVAKCCKNAHSERREHKTCFEKCLNVCKRKSNNSEGNGCVGILVKWFIKFLVLSSGIISKSTSVLDAVTDIILLYKASTNNATMFTIISLICLLSPYILSYSAGVQIWVQRRTFENVQPFTFRSLLLGLYLFPTGIIYFIILDVIDILVEVYKWFGYTIINKIKTPQELVKIDSTVALYFGMSRMDFFSFKKQKIIAQLFFESVPQTILQVLLFRRVITGKELLNGITDADLIRSISIASINVFVQLFRLFAESVAVKESFVQYSLNCITARFGWLPFKHLIDENNINNFKSNFCTKIFEKKNESSIDFTIQYKLPLITFLSAWWKQKNANTPLRVGCDYKETDVKYGCVQYDFSFITINSLISAIKSLPQKQEENETGIKTIKFGHSLRLLDVRSIISLMQSCKDKDIILLDIDKIDWQEAFKNTTNSGDARLISHTFDAKNKSLLTSLYLTGYGSQNDYNILRKFVSAYDVPINIQDDKGDTILHHIIRCQDYNAIYALLESLKPKQRVNFMTVNDNQETVIQEMMKQNDYKELKRLLDTIQSKSYDIPVNAKDEKGNTVIHHMVRNKAYDDIYTFMNGVKEKQIFYINAQNNDGNTVTHEIVQQNNYYELKRLLDFIDQAVTENLNFNLFNSNGESILYLALQKDLETLGYTNRKQLTDHRKEDINKPSLSTVIEPEHDIFGIESEDDVKQIERLRIEKKQVFKTMLKERKKVSKSEDNIDEYKRQISEMEFQIENLKLAKEEMLHKKSDQKAISSKLLDQRNTDANSKPGPMDNNDSNKPFTDLIDGFGSSALPFKVKENDTHSDDDGNTIEQVSDIDSDSTSSQALEMKDTILLDVGYDAVSEATHVYSWLHGQKIDSKNKTAIKQLKQRLASLLTSRSEEYRQTLIGAYRQQYNRSLENDIKKIIVKGHAMQIIHGLLMTRAQYDAILISEYVANWDIDPVADIICCRSMFQLQELHDAYKKKCKLDVKKQLQALAQKDKKKTLVKIIGSILDLNRKENINVDMNKVNSDLNFVLTTKKFKDQNKERLVMIFTENSVQYIKVLNDQFLLKSKDSLTTFIDKKLGPKGTSGYYCKTRIMYALDTADYYAQKIKTLGKNYKKNKKKIQDIFIQRMEIDLELIKRVWSNKKYGDGKNLKLWITGKTAGSKSGYFLSKMLDNCSRYNEFHRKNDNKPKSKAEKMMMGN